MHGTLKFDAIATFAFATALLTGSAQTPPAFEVASIKLNDPSSRTPPRLETLPDGTFRMIGTPLLQVIVTTASFKLGSLDDIIGLPDWVLRERYDIIAKPFAGAPADQQNDRLRRLLAERMKYAAHVEERDRDTYGLVFATSDKKLGSQLKPSTLDCSPNGSGRFTPPGQRPGMAAFQNRCGVSVGPGWVVSGGTTIERMASALRGPVGRTVIDRTGLQGNYSWSVQFAPLERGADIAPADAPDIVTAIREQLGLRLQPERTKVPVLVVDRIERPTPD